MKIKTKKGALVSQETVHAHEAKNRSENKRRSNFNISDLLNISGDVVVEMSDKLNQVYMVASSLLNTNKFFDTIDNLEKHGELFPSNVWTKLSRGFLRYCIFRLRVRYVLFTKRFRRKV